MWLTTKDVELGENPSGATISTEYQAVRLGTPRIVRRIFNEEEHMAERVVATGREIDKLENKKAYFEGIVANSVFPDAGELAALQKEKESIMTVLEATSAEEELVKDILSEDDSYVTGPNQPEEDDDEDYRFVASVESLPSPVFQSEIQPSDPRLRV
ncbi:MAG: hypothetical protein HKL84_06745 [Acidimicrobiaceae bacterium]|nr:hypothetical protein [Acidimicrobiaceae bacterium]